MSSDKHLSIHPPEIQFAFEVNTQMFCAIQVRNTTDCYVAFKVEIPDPEKYRVRPNYGIVLPLSTCHFLVTMQAQNEAPADMHCEDKFQILSVITSPKYTLRDITSDTFKKEPEFLVDEYEMRVTFVPPEPTTVLEASLNSLTLDATAVATGTGAGEKHIFTSPPVLANKCGGSSSSDVQGGAINMLSNSAGTSLLKCITASQFQQMFDLMNIPTPKDRFHECSIADEDEIIGERFLFEDRKKRTLIGANGPREDRFYFLGVPCWNCGV